MRPGAKYNKTIIRSYVRTISNASAIWFSSVREVRLLVMHRFSREMALSTCQRWP